MESQSASPLEKRVINLPPDEARYIDTLVASGSYASAGEVVGAGLRALQEHEAAIDDWLRDDVAPVYDAMQTDPGRARSGGEVGSRLLAHHAARSKKDDREV